MNRFVTSVLLLMVFLLQIEPAHSEWYVSGYGGYSAAQPLNDVTMNNFGLRSAVTRYNFNPSINSVLGDTLTQNFQTSDLSLEQSALFGGKGGYFFKDEGFSWLGVEVEAFTTTPTIKTQTVSTEQGITFIKRDFVAGCPAQPLGQCTIQEHLQSTLPVTESSLRLITVLFNVVARYPGEIFQPYVGVGGGAFYFSSSGQIDGRQVVPGLNLEAGLKVLATKELGLFVEGKYNYATISNLDPAGFGLSGVYNAFNIVSGIAYHF